MTTQVTILVLGGATLLDDGPFLIVAAVAATVALIVCGARRLLAATSDQERLRPLLAERDGDPTKMLLHPEGAPPNPE